MNTSSSSPGSRTSTSNMSSGSSSLAREERTVSTEISLKGSLGCPRACSCSLKCSLKSSTCFFFSLIKISSSTFLDPSLFHLALTKFPPQENTLSLFADEAGIVKTFLANFDNKGSTFSQLFHSTKQEYQPPC